VFSSTTRPPPLPSPPPNASAGSSSSAAGGGQQQAAMHMRGLRAGACGMHGPTVRDAMRAGIQLRQPGQPKLGKMPDKLSKMPLKQVTVQRGTHRHPPESSRSKYDSSSASTSRSPPAGGSRGGGGVVNSRHLRQQLRAVMARSDDCRHNAPWEPSRAPQGISSRSRAQHAHIFAAALPPPPRAGVPAALLPGLPCGPPLPPPSPRRLGRCRAQGGPVCA